MYILYSLYILQMAVRELLLDLMMRFAWPATGLLPVRASHDSPSLCPYKVPSGSKLPTRDMAYYRA
jgi:hypothetical protein